MRYLKGSISYGLRLQADSKLQVQGFADADWASNIDDRKSVSGYCVYFGSNLVSWSSKKQHVVARSSTEAEYRALAHITAKICWLHNLSQELHFNLTCPIVWSDNTEAAALAANLVLHACVKHIEIDLHFVRNKVSHKSLEVRYIPSHEQVADIFTKPLGTAQFMYLRSKLHIEELIRTSDQKSH